MVTRVRRCIAVLLLAFLVGIGGLVAYLYASPVQLHEFDTAWYHTDLHVTDVAARSFRAQHRSAVFRAQCDHFVHPVGPGRVIGLVGASAPDDSGNVFLFFGSAFASGDVGLHLLPVYCWSERQQRLVWKGLQDNSP